MTMDPWITALCERLDVPIDDVDVSAILDLAKDAAHQVERPAAPVTAFIAGYAAAAKGGGSTGVDAAIDAAAELAAQWREASNGAESVAQQPSLEGTDADESQASGAGTTST